MNLFLLMMLHLSQTRIMVNLCIKSIEMRVQIMVLTGTLGRRLWTYMVLSDFLFTNTDRHLLNLGVLRDVKTLRFVKPIIF